VTLFHTFFDLLPHPIELQAFCVENIIIIIIVIIIIIIILLTSDAA